MTEYPRPARKNSGMSGAIAPTAIAAGTSGVRRNGSATTACAGVNGIRYPTRNPARVRLPRRSTAMPPARPALPTVSPSSATFALLR